MSLKKSDIAKTQLKEHELTLGLLKQTELISLKVVISTRYTRLINLRVVTLIIRIKLVGLRVVVVTKYARLVSLSNMR